MKKGSLNEKPVQIFVLVGFIMFISTYILFKYVFSVSNYGQWAVDVLWHYAIIGLMVFVAKKHGLWAIPYIIASVLVVAYAEIQSVFFLENYSYNNFPSAIFFNYPLTIAFAWVFMSYSSYLITNIMFLGREHKNGFHRCGYLLDKPIYKSLGLILFLTFIDGLILMFFGLLNETVGIELDYWTYVPKDELKFFGITPTITLYTYFYASFMFNIFFRLLEYVMNKFRSDNTLSFGKTDFYPLYFYFLYLGYLIFEIVTQTPSIYSQFPTGIDHWTVFVSFPVLVLFFVFTYNRFNLDLNKKEIEA